MRAQVNQRFIRGFVLTEEGVVKIADILTNRLQREDGQPIDINIDVHRLDHALITCSKVSEVLSEQNGKIDRIESLRFYSSDDGDAFTINFEKGERIYLNIASDSRDRALLTLSDLREFIRNEVERGQLRGFNSILRYRLTIPIVFLASVAIGMSATLSAVRRSVILPASENSIAEKIDYLYRSRIAYDDSIDPSRFIIWMLGIPLSIGFFIMLLSIIIPFFFPTDLFLWGKEKERYNKLISFRGRVVWTIGIGLLVSLLSGAIISYASGVRAS